MSDDNREQLSALRETLRQAQQELQNTSGEFDRDLVGRSRLLRQVDMLSHLVHMRETSEITA